MSAGNSPVASRHASWSFSCCPRTCAAVHPEISGRCRWHRWCFQGIHSEAAEIKPFGYFGCEAVSKMAETWQNPSWSRSCSDGGWLDPHTTSKSTHCCGHRLSILSAGCWSEPGARRSTGWAEHATAMVHSLRVSGCGSTSCFLRGICFALSCSADALRDLFCRYHWFAVAGHWRLFGGGGGNRFGLGCFW